MTDDNENKKEPTDYVIIPSLLIAIEQLHERDSVIKMLEGKPQTDSNMYFNAVFLFGIQATASRLDKRDCLNDQLIALIREQKANNGIIK